MPEIKINTRHDAHEILESEAAERGLSITDFASALLAAYAYGHLGDCPRPVEDVAVLALLEKMLQSDALEGEREIIIGHYGGGRIVYVQERRREDGALLGHTIVNGRAPTLYPALLLAAKALDENEANEQDIGPSHDDPLIGD